MGRRASPISSVSPASQSQTSVSSDNEIDWPFGARVDALSRAELRETAYEIFFMSCRCSPGGGSGSRGSVTIISSGGEMVEVSSSPLPPAVAGSKGGKGMMVVTSRVKKTLGLKTRRPPPMRTMNPTGLTSVAIGKPSAVLNSPCRNPVPSSPSRIKRPMTSAELLRWQLRITDQSETRLRKTLMRSFVAQNGRRAETIILPLELLRHLKPSEFNDGQDYHQWQRRQIKILELGLLLHPFLPLDRLNAAALRFREIHRQSEAKPIDTSKNSETLRTLSSAVTALAWRSSSSSATGETCHWADGFPLNVHLYLSLLQSIFDVREETVVLDEIDELLELMKKTWPTLGINRTIHNLCFTWILFQQYVTTGQVEPDLIKASLNMLVHVANDAKMATERELSYIKVLFGVLASMQGWAEKRMLDYHENFDKATTGNMETILSLALSTTKIIVEDLPGMDTTPGLVKPETAAGGGSAASRVEYYIHKSLRNAFTRLFETGHGNVDSMIVEVDEDPGEIILQLAKDAETLAAKEKEVFSPVLRQWCPAAAGLAIVTIYNCFGIVLKQYLAKANSLTDELVRVLHCAGRLEKMLAQMVADDAGDKDDGGRNLVGEMVPYEVDAIAVALLKAWMEERLRIGRESLNRAKEIENWMPRSKKEPFAQSAVDLIKLAKVTVDEFFEIPVTARDDMVQDLADGLEAIFQEYTHFVASCGTRQSYLPQLPPLTRCNQDSRLAKLWKKAKPCTSTAKPCTPGTDNDPLFIGRAVPTPVAAGGTPAGETHHPRTSTSRGTQRLYIRINTLHYLHSHIHSLDKSLTFFSRGSSSAHHHQLHHNRRLTPAAHFDLIRASIQSAILHVSEIAAYRLIFLDSAHSYHSLYVGDVAGSRIRPCLRILKQNLNTLLTILTDRAQPVAVREVMRASFEMFLMVILAGGTERVFVRTDYEVVLEDFRNMKRVFCASGEGLVAEEVVDREAEVVEGVIGLMSLPTERLIEEFTAAARETSVAVAMAEGRRIPMPATAGRWSRSDPNTVLRVLCHRNDDTANYFLKKAFQLPKRR
ncbi:uncharacterized protein LOC110023753 [Phalaenopsis equestris]|uniref:uncharacterized protein LOC110023753 n=1 Tax=Phalaenopsis equestris TaxID=78828 RepID=UPI0009E5D70D|nr:uncharacterized protein LOC110023753 [Phalaenopsis equestris]